MKRTGDAGTRSFSRRRCSRRQPRTGSRSCTRSSSPSSTDQHATSLRRSFISTLKTLRKIRYNVTAVVNKFPPLSTPTWVAQQKHLPWMVFTTLTLHRVQWLQRYQAKRAFRTFATRLTRKNKPSSHRRPKWCSACTNMNWCIHSKGEIRMINKSLCRKWKLLCCIRLIWTATTTGQSTRECFEPCL